MADLHTRLHAEVERRLAIARLAEEWHPSPWRYQIGDMKLDVIADSRGGWAMTFAHHREPVVPTVKHVEQHSPADAIRRYEGELAVLDRHTPETPPWRSVPVCAYEWATGTGWPVPVDRCPEVLGVAYRLGIEVGDVQ